MEKIGDRIPIWDEYVGGGTILVFFVAAVFGTYGLVPEKFMKAVDVFYNKQPVNFLEMFIPALIVGSVLTVDRKTLIKSISGYVPLIIVGVFGASCLWYGCRIYLWKNSSRCNDELCFTYNGWRNWSRSYTYV